MNRPANAIALAIASAFAGNTAEAVSLADDGLGQALIYPYYTVRASGNGNAFNTYLSVTNTTSDAKVLRVRVREGRAGREAISFNLYLSPNDVWVGAIAPTAAGAHLLTVDSSCTDPPLFEVAGTLREIALNNFQFSGSQADGNGDTLDRTREGYVEMIEMATVSGTLAAAVTHNAAGIPVNCAAIQSAQANAFTAPSGGLFGSLTLINVNSGQDFTLDATALADLSTRSFYRPPADPYPDLAAAEIDPVSVVSANGFLYRSTWPRAVDAVSAVLMRSHWWGEYVLDNATASLTDWVVTLPTRHHHAGATQFTPPFTSNARWRENCGLANEPLASTFVNREERSATAEGCGTPGCAIPPIATLCAASGVAMVRNPASTHMPSDLTRTGVLGSTTQGYLFGGNLVVTAGFQTGMAWVTPTHPQSTLASLATSSRTEPVTGAVAMGPHTFRGLPIIGFGVRSFTNGTLACAGAATCQGNYGSAFNFRYGRTITGP